MNNNPEAGFGSAAEFQSSGLPWVTSSVGGSSPQRWSFPKVTRCITVRNTTTGSGGYLMIGFTQLGVQGSNNYILPPNTQEQFEVRCKELWIMAAGAPANYSIFAALTTIPERNMPVLTGSMNGTGSWIGVG